MLASSNGTTVNTHAESVHYKNNVQTPSTYMYILNMHLTELT